MSQRTEALDAPSASTDAEPLQSKAHAADSRPAWDFAGTQLFRDLVASFRAPGFWVYGAWIDTVLQYRTQALGLFWMVSGTLVFVLVLGSLYSQVLGAQGQHYTAHLVTGIVVWTFMQQCLHRATRIFSVNGNMIQNGYVHYADYVLRLFFATCIELAHNLLVVAGVLIFTGIALTSAAWVLLVTVPLVFVTIIGGSFIFAVAGGRYPDLQNVLLSILRIAIFVTPIIWVPHMLGRSDVIGPFLYLNPFYYLIEVVRAPLVYGFVPWFEIGVVAAAIPFIWTMAARIYGRAKPYIPLWV